MYVALGVFCVWVFEVGICGCQGSECDGCHVCFFQWVVCFWVCMVCLFLEISLVVCGVCLASVHVLIALWVGQVAYYRGVRVWCMVVRETFWVHAGCCVWRGVFLWCGDLNRFFVLGPEGWLYAGAV